ncbi:MAG: glycosyl transferase [Methylococcales bacterium]|nr:glycosyl transferase [Methylococcales bacterium]
MPKAQIVCMKWGDKYPAHYVNVLYAMARRHIQGDLRFVCLTDDASDVRPEVECLPCPDIAIPAPFNNTGWRKITLWTESLPDMTGDWLFLDLDVVVTGPLDDFFTFKPEASFVVMHNFTQPGTGIGNTSVYRFRVGSHPYLLERTLKEPLVLVKQYRNEQTFVSRCIKEIEYWPEAWCLLFKVHCVPPMPLRWWRPPALPETARVVAFPGEPNPDQAIAGLWPAKKSYKKIYKHILPTDWVAEHWRE